MSVSIFLVRAVVEGAERAGAARADLRDRLRFDWQRLEQPEARLEFEQLEQALSVAVAVTGDDALGLHLAEHVSEGAFDLLAHLAAHAPTMRKAIEIAAQFTGLTMDGVLLRVRDEGDEFVATFAFPRSTPLSDRVLAELMMAGLVRLARSSFGPTVVPRLACFEHEQPSYHHEYSRIFGANCRFSQSVTAITFDREIVDRPQANQNPALYDVLRAEAERRIERMTAGVRPAARLRNYHVSDIGLLEDLATVERRVHSNIHEPGRLVESTWLLQKGVSTGCDHLTVGTGRRGEAGLRITQVRLRQHDDVVGIVRIDGDARRAEPALGVVAHVHGRKLERQRHGGRRRGGRRVVGRDGRRSICARRSRDDHGCVHDNRGVRDARCVHGARCVHDAR